MLDAASIQILILRLREVAKRAAEQGDTLEATYRELRAQRWEQYLATGE